jgi:hypothetical protein
MRPQSKLIGGLGVAHSLKPLTFCFKWLGPAGHHDEEWKEQVGQGSPNMEWAENGGNHTWEAETCRHTQPCFL